MHNPVRILYLEDSPRDAELVRDTLQRIAMPHELRVASDRAAYEAALTQTRFDLILSDYALPNYDGMAALALAREKQPDVPFILISGTLGEERAVDCVVHGATDYVLKQNLNRLVPAVLRALTEAGEHEKRQAAEASLRTAEHRYRDLFDQANEGLLIMTLDGQVTEVNCVFAEAHGYTVAELERINIQDLDVLKEQAMDSRAGLLRRMQAGEVLRFEAQHFHKDGQIRPFAVTSRMITLADQSFYLASHQDITAIKRVEAEKRKLEDQLHQAQKMEAVGRLAGGVAHDFNNLLMGIMGYAELCRDAIAPDHPIREYLDEITSGAERSAAITGQLLAFARKQTIAPRVLDLNDAVAGMLKLLRRLIGEDINLAWRPGANLRPVKLDPSQIDQILANLCVNSRDAIAGVGEVTLETGSSTVDAEYCITHADAIPGAYVFLAVSDDGCGMDKETLAQVFEPFFTTKGLGKGTGLGLATVYGIVKQNNGFIYAYSEPGKGTTFKIYLPETAAETVATTVTSKTEAPRGRGETVLVVEDEKSLRVTCGLFLEALDYKVLVAETPGEAMKMIDRHPGDIHVLLTDVVMPGMDGRQLAKRISAVKPGVKVLFMSGYTADVIAQRGVLDEGVQFLSKPFTRDDLARKMRGLLEGPLLPASV